MKAAKELYGAVVRAGKVSKKATLELRARMRADRVGGLITDESRFCRATPFARLGVALSLARDDRGTHVMSNAGYILATGTTQWRKGAVARTYEKLPKSQGIQLHEKLALTAFYCPASGALLSVDVHRKTDPAVEDLNLDLGSVESLNKA